MKIGLSRWIHRQPSLQPRSKLGGIPLSWILTVPYVVQAGVLLLGVGYLTYRHHNQSVEQVARQLLTQASDHVGGYLGRVLEIPHRINRVNQQGIQQGLLPGPDSTDPSALELYFQHQVAQFASVSSIAMGNGRGGMVGAGYYQGSLGVFSTEGFVAGAYTGGLMAADGTVGERRLIASAFDARIRPWYVAPRQVGRAVWSPIYAYIAPEPILGISAGLPIVSASGQIEGVLTADLNLQHLDQFLTTARPTPRSRVYIVEPSGLLVASSESLPLFELPAQPGADLIRVAAQESADPLVQQSAEFVLSQVGDLGQIEALGSWRTRLAPEVSRSEFYGIGLFPFRDPYGLDWRVVLVIPEADLAIAALAESRWAVLILELALLGALGYGLWLSQRIHRWLRQLTQSAQAVASGTLELDLPDSPIAEVKDLTRAFAQMVVSLREADALRQNYTQALEQQVSTQTAALMEAQQMAQTGNWEYDITTGRSRWSAQLYRIYEADPDQPVADPDRQIMRIHPDDEPRYHEMVAVAQSLQPFAADLRILTQKGNVRHIFAKGQPVMAEDGSVQKLVGIVTDITERKQTELALAASEARFRRISDSSPALIYILISHADGSVSYEHLSQAVQAIYGISPEQALAQPDLLYGQIHPEDRAAYDAAVEHCLATLDPFTHEWRIVDPAGEIKWVKASAQPQSQADGDMAWYGILLNVTRRKQTEDKLSRILDSSLDGIIQFRALRDPQNKIIDFIYEVCNPAACRLLKYTEADLIGTRLLEQFPGIQSLTLLERWTEVVNTGQSLRQDLYYDQDELRAWFELSAVKFGDGVVITFRDISQFKQAQNHLTQLNQELNKRVEERTHALRIQMEQEMILRNIVQSIHSSLDFEQVLETLLQETHRILSADHLLVYQWQPERDPDYAHCLVRSAHSQVGGTQLGRLSAGWRDLFESTDAVGHDPNPDSDSLYRWFGDVLAICDRDRIQLQDLSFSPLIRLINQLPLRSALMAPIKPDGILWGWLAVYRDTPSNWQGWEMKLLQQLSLQAAIACRQSQLYAAAQQQVQELEKLNQLKDDFLSTVSHELRTPMSNIKMAVSLLEMGLTQQGIFQDPHSRLARHFGILKQESEREIQMINDLLEFSRLEAHVDPISVQFLDLESFLSGLLPSFMEKAQKNQQHLHLVVRDPGITLFTHPPYLGRILQELLQNACKYTPPGESITLEARAEDGLIVITITNTGVEIPASEQARIFERFYRITGSDRWKHGGTGLGLALVKELAERLGGSIGVASQPGWTQFILKLSLNPATEQSDQQRSGKGN